MAARSITPDGAKIRTLRKGKGWEQADLSEVSGVSMRVVQKAEASRPLSPKSLAYLAESLGVPVAELLPPPAPSDSARADSDDITIEIVINGNANPEELEKLARFVSALTNSNVSSANIKVTYESVEQDKTQVSDQ